ncbi:unnamed protein product [Phytomonas sp. EM1]|nr:unnamed protein product [Phytomonas sp. EM1]|eukprot:CCW61384.1 unnamed protein product [Phytomonas sp. isolate EM1]
MACSCSALRLASLSQQGGMGFGSERHAQEFFHRLVVKFWSPFNQGRKGFSLSVYNFKENLDNIVLPNHFTVQLNGVVGGRGLLEDFFTVLLCGFDIENVVVKAPCGVSPSGAFVADHFTLCGDYTISHVRSFLGWKPSTHGNALLPSETVLASALFPEQPQLQDLSTAQDHLQLKIPFRVYVEGSLTHPRLCHMVLRTPVFDTLAGLPTRWGCPEEVKQILRDPEALKMLATLRQANVCAKMISAKTLLRARNPAEGCVDTS